MHPCRQRGSASVCRRGIPTTHRTGTAAALADGRQARGREHARELHRGSRRHDPAVRRGAGLLGVLDLAERPVEQPPGHELQPGGAVQGRERAQHLARRCGDELRRDDHRAARARVSARSKDGPGAARPGGPQGVPALRRRVARAPAAEEPRRAVDALPATVLQEQSPRGGAQAHDLGRRRPRIEATRPRATPTRSSRPAHCSASCCSSPASRRS